MSKKLIRNSAAISLGTLILSILFFVVGNSNTVITTVAILCAIACIITASISYFGALVKTARIRRRGWFVGILLFGVMAALLYGLMGPETQVSNQAMSTFLYQSYKDTKKTMGY